MSQSCVSGDVTYACVSRLEFVCGMMCGYVYKLILWTTHATSAKWVLTFNLVFFTWLHTSLGTLQLAASLVVVYIHHIVGIHMMNTLPLNTLWLGKLPYSLKSFCLIWGLGIYYIRSHYGLCKEITIYLHYERLHTMFDYLLGATYTMIVMKLWAYGIGRYLYEGVYTNAKT